MSRAYKIRVKESMSRTLRAEDVICTELQVLEILPKEQMAELLAKELAGRGFVREGSTLSRDHDGVTTSVDVDTGEVVVRAAATEEVKLDGTREGLAYDDFGPGEAHVRKQLQDQLEQDLKRRAEHEQTKLQSEATQRLERHLEALKPELDQALNKVTGQALKQKAAQLGRIKDVSEDESTGSLTITVEV